MQHGWHDFHRYDWVTPLAMCEPAVETSIGRVWRHGEQDSAPLAVRSQAPPPAAMGQIAAHCGVDTLLPRAVQQVVAGHGGQPIFWPAYRLALALGRDTVAATLLRGMLAQATTRSEQAGVLLGAWWADTGMTGLHPMRPALLERLATLADSLLQRPGMWKVPAADSLAARIGFYGTIFATRSWLTQYWLRLGDTARARAGAETTLAICARLHPHESMRPCLGNELSILVDLAILQHGVRSKEIVAVLTRRERMLTGDSTARGTVLPIFLYFDKPFVWPETPYWYSPHGAPVATPTVAGTSPTAAIAPGKVTLIWEPPDGSDHRLIGSSANQLTRAAGMLHKLLAQYGPQGLQLVVIGLTRGMAAGTGVVAHEQEAPAIRQLYQEQFQLPAAVVVDTVPFRYLPDGRRQDGYSAWERRYIPTPQPQWRAIPSPEVYWNAISGFLLDKHGKIRIIRPTYETEDPMLEYYIQEALKEP